MSSHARSQMLVDAVLETFIRHTRSTRHTAAWSAVFNCMAVPFLVRGDARRVQSRLDGEAVEALLFGRAKRFRTLCTRVLCCPLTSEPHARSPLWPSRLAAPGTQLVAVEIHPWLAPRLRDDGWVIVPEAVRWRGPIEELPPRQPSESLEADLRKIARYGYEREVVAGEACWDEFELRMLRPYAQTRFGDDVWLPTPSYMRFLARSTVVFARRDGRRVAGGSIVVRNGEGWLAMVGVRDGDVRWMREGAITAVYAFALAWAREQGSRMLDVGRTSSFRCDGLARYKAKWGFRPAVEPLSPLFAMRADPDCGRLRRAFEREPVLVLGASGLHVFDGGPSTRPL